MKKENKIKKGIAIFGVLLFLMLATTQVTSAGVLPTHRDYVVEPHGPGYEWWIYCCAFLDCEHCEIWDRVRWGLDLMYIVR